MDVDELRAWIERQWTHAGEHGLQPYIKLGVVVAACWAAVKLISQVPALLRAVGTAVGWLARGQIWRESGKALSIAHYLLLVLAFGLYGEEQGRTVGAALKEEYQSRLAEIVPLAIVTQWVLLLTLWLLFASLMGLDRKKIIEPFHSLLGFPLLMATVMLYTPVWMALARKHTLIEYVLGAMILSATLAPLCVLAVIGRRGRKASRPAQDGPESPSLPGQLATLMPRRASPVAEIVLIWRSFMLLLTLIAVGCSVPYWLGKPEPTLSGVYHVEFVVFSVMFLFACWTFRSELMEVDGLPPALPGFIDLTLTLATAGIALGGVTQSNISLGAVPPWLIVLGPPLVMAAGIYFVELRGKRDGTLRWRACVGAALTAAVMIVPLKAALTAALPPVLALLPLPSHL